MPSRRVTDFLLFAAVFTMSFEKIYWNVAGKISLSEVLSILFVGVYLLMPLLITTGGQLIAAALEFGRERLDFRSWGI